MSAPAELAHAQPTGGLAAIGAELRRRPLARAALWVLVLLHALAVYAPLLANDRPYLLEAVDRGAYERARRALTGVAGGLSALALEGADAYAAARADVPTAPDYAEAIALEREALAARLATMRRYLTAENHATLDALERTARRAAARALDDRPDSGGTAAAATRLREETRAVARALAVRDGDAPERGGVELVGHQSYPLLAALGPLEVGCMLLAPLALCWPLWRRLARGAGARRALVLGWLGAAALGALAWATLVGVGARLDGSGTKRGLTDGEIVATRAVFPPLALGFAETHVEESFRPPTWTAASEVDAAGRYVRGPRAPRPDPLTAELPASAPVDVRFAEPGRNAALRHPLGTDESGRDLFVRMLHGGRVSLAVGLVSTLVLGLVGLLVGVSAGYAGGRTDLLLSRVIEVVQCIPAFFLVLAAVALVPARGLHPLLAVVLVIGLVRWTGVARLVRAEFLRLREQEFVLAARALGLSPLRVAVRHVLPNALGPVLVALVFSVAAGILTESAISFLGFGVREPIPSWGGLLSESRALEHWWLQVFPGLAIFVTVLCTNLLGEGLRDALDPRLAGAPRRSAGPRPAADAGVDAPRVPVGREAALGR